MKIKSKLFVLCEEYSVDDRQRPSIINIYDSIFAEDYPAMHQLLKYVSNLEIKDNNKVNSVGIQLKLTGPDDVAIFESPVQKAAIVPNMKEQIIGSVFDIQMVPFPQRGRYTATLYVNDEEVETHNVQLRGPLPPEA